jgi:hypothetical protein
MPRIDLNPTPAQLAAFTSATRAARKQMFDAAAAGNSNGEFGSLTSPAATQTQEEIAARQLHPTLANRPVKGVTRPAYERAKQQPRRADRELPTAEELEELRALKEQKEQPEPRRGAPRNPDYIDEDEGEGAGEREGEYERQVATSATRNRRQGRTRSGQEYE